jgi:hypothetical protein
MCFAKERTAPVRDLSAFLFYYIRSAMAPLDAPIVPLFGFRTWQGQNYIKKKPHKRLFEGNSVNIFLIFVLVPKVILLCGIVRPNFLY